MIPELKKYRISFEKTHVIIPMSIFNHALAVLLHHNEISECFHLIYNLHQNKYDKCSYSNLMNTLIKARLYDLAIATFHRMEAKGIEISHVTVTILLRALQAAKN